MYEGARAAIVCVPCVPCGARAVRVHAHAQII